MSSNSVQFDALQQAIDDIRTCHNALVQEKEGLESFLKNLGAEWYGSAAGAWTNTQNSWNQACDGVNTILRQLMTSLEEAHHTFKGTEYGLEQLWTG